MSYDIIYGRQFIRTTRGIIPLVLGGSNNCTMFYGGKEIRERHWFVPYGDDWIDCPEAVLLEKAEKRLGGPGRSEEECLVIGSKWANCGEFLRYLRNGVKNARPIEEICELRPGQYLSCLLSHYNAISDPWQHDLQQEIRTTPELELWIDQARKRKQDLLADGMAKCVCICISFQGIRPLCIDRASTSSRLSGAVLAKYKNDYVERVDGRRVQLCGSIARALEFEKIEDAKLVLPTLSSPYCFISAKNKAKDARKRCVLRVTEGSRAGLYLRRRCARSLYFTTDANNAKRFITENAAQKWFTEYIGSRFPGVKAAESIRLT